MNTTGPVDTTTPHLSPISTPSDIGLVRGVLIASAAALLLLVGVRLSTAIAPAHAGEIAGADVVSQVGDYTMLTLGADNDDVLIVLDGRNETLSAYRVKNKNSFDLIEARELKTIFAEGRRIGSGK